MPSTITTQPTHEPVSLTEAKKWLEVDDNRHDTTIADLITAARLYAEQETGRKLVTQTIVEYFDRLPANGCLELSFSPVSSITSFEYRDDVDGTYQTFSTSDYEKNTVNEPARIELNEDSSWPDYGEYINPIKVTYVAGYGGSEVVDERIKAGIKMLVSYWFDNREDAPMKYTGDIIRSAKAVFMQAKAPQSLI